MAVNVEAAAMVLNKRLRRPKICGGGGGEKTVYGLQIRLRVEALVEADPAVKSETVVIAAVAVVAVAAMTVTAEAKYLFINAGDGDCKDKNKFLATNINFEKHFFPKE